MNWKKRFRKELNKRSAAEKILHFALQKRGIGAKRNKAVQGYSGKWRFVDLFIRRYMLGIEIDGPEHDPVVDAERDADILARNRRWQIIRFKNSDVFGRLESVVDRVMQISGHVYREKKVSKMGHKISPMVMREIKEQENHLHGTNSPIAWKTSGKAGRSVFAGGWFRVRLRSFPLGISTGGGPAR